VFWSAWILLAAAIAVAAALTTWAQYVVGAGAINLVSNLAGLVFGDKSAPPLGQLLVAILVVAVAVFLVLFFLVVMVGLSIVVAGWSGVAHLTAAASRRLGVAVPLADASADALRWLKDETCFLNSFLLVFWAVGRQGASLLCHTRFLTQIAPVGHPYRQKQATTAPCTLYSCMPCPTESPLLSSLTVTTLTPALAPVTAQPLSSLLI
jgi:hypothetical protein